MALVTIRSVPPGLLVQLTIMTRARRWSGSPMPLRLSVHESAGKLAMFLRTLRAEVTKVAWERREAKWISATPETTVVSSRAGTSESNHPDFLRGRRLPLI